MSRSSRKQDHIRFALSTGQSGDNGFADIHIIPNALPETALAQIDLQCKIGELSLSSPILINAMTGGGDEGTKEINKKLAILAKEAGLPMAVGSQTAALQDSRLLSTYQVVRQENPQGIIFANIAANRSLEDAQKAVEMIEADALQLHVNVIQELVMPEGDRDFTGILKNIEQIKREIDVPLIVKEVGFGFSKESIRQLLDIGVDYIDIGGYGGTNFAAIENKRRAEPLPHFEQWGMKTAISLLEACSLGEGNFIASGGIRTPLEVVKALMIGAKLVGLAGYFLRLIHLEDLELAIKKIEDFKLEIKRLMCALGAKTVADLLQIPFVVQGEACTWLGQRGIDLSRYAQRASN